MFDRPTCPYIHQSVDTGEHARNILPLTAVVARELGRCAWAHWLHPDRGVMAEAVRILAPPRWSARTALRQALRLSQYADLLIVLSRHRITVRYKQSLLGGLWAVLQPLAMMLVYTVVFSRLVRVPSQGVPYALFAYAGLLPWTFFSGTLSSGTSSLVGHTQLVTKVYFPREILPLSYVISGVVDFLIGSVALIALTMFYDVPLTGAVLWVGPIMLALAALALSGGLVLAVVQVRFRDVGVALPIALQLLMFASPVLYPLEVVPAAWRPFYELNPLSGLIDGFRRSVVGLPLDPSALGLAWVVTLALLPLAYLVFKHADVTIADVI
jgi:homopolymeric O-antigen transport system permease protein